MAKSLGTLVTLLLALLCATAALGQSGTSAPSKAAATQPASSTSSGATKLSPEEQARKLGLREKPLAAGRVKDAVNAEAQSQMRIEQSQRMLDMVNRDCAACHECSGPTMEDPCLRMCPERASRTGVAQMIVEEAREILPEDVVLLKAFEWGERRFLPVPFNHRLHSNMAGMAGGCQGCHHHTTPGQIHPRCTTCHKAVLAQNDKEEMRMPSLKGAYHRQCMGCHRDWSHETKCSICHVQKGDRQEPVNPKELLSSDDVAAHPLIENPDEIVHKTNYDPGPHVVFRHKDHIERCGYGCERCHKGQTCSRCHEQDSNGKHSTSGPYKREQTHGACFPCHEDDRCERCHSKDARPQPQYFDHAVTGFPLGRFHKELTCRACHKRLFFTRKLKGDCTFCHNDWTVGKFNHAKATGLTLDENHAETECEQCHLERKFEDKPVCTECHDKEFTYPARKPGKLADKPSP